MKRRSICSVKKVRRSQETIQVAPNDFVSQHSRVIRREKPGREKRQHETTPYIRWSSIMRSSTRYGRPIRTMRSAGTMRERPEPKPNAWRTSKRFGRTRGRSDLRKKNGCRGEKRIKAVMSSCVGKRRGQTVGPPSDLLPALAIPSNSLRLEIGIGGLFRIVWFPNGLWIADSLTDGAGFPFSLSGS